jgi:hypothetical protein
MQINRLPHFRYDPKREKYKKKYREIGERQPENPEVIKQYCEEYERIMSIVRLMNLMVEDEELIENYEKTTQSKLNYKIVSLDKYDPRVRS